MKLRSAFFPAVIAAELLPAGSRSFAQESPHWHFRPSCSVTGDHLVFFRRLKDDPDVNKWISTMRIINTDGTGFHQLSDVSLCRLPRARIPMRAPSHARCAE